MSRVAQILVSLLLVGVVVAQTPTGTIAGVARDLSGGAVAGAQIKLRSSATTFTRTALTSAQGDYSFPALPAGEYEVSAEASGFERIVRQATVEAGATTTADFDLRIGDTKTSVTVDEASPQMHYDSHTIGGVVTHSQIEALPLNGRSFLELAKLEPGVQAPTVRTSDNRAHVPVLGTSQPASGQDGSGTRVTIDGASVMSPGYPGSKMGLSQEAVQEFQISTVNPDLSTGLTDAGAINIVTRSGGNDLHGAAFYFLRDHKLSAYPALNRDPANPDPFFQRRQFGFAGGGPIRHDRVFFFGNWERNEQRGVVNTTIVGTDFGQFSRITPSPFFGDQATVRVDGRLSSAHTGFVRYSHDGSRSFGPNSGTPYPSNWSSNSVWVDQSVLGFTSVIRPTLVNDVRFSYFFSSTTVSAAREQDCSGCLGVGAPNITVAQSGLTVGSSNIVRGVGRRFQASDSLVWQRGAHRARFGFDWEQTAGGNLVWNNQPVSMALFSPDTVRAYNARPQTPADMRIPLPDGFRTLNDILSLPLQNFTVDMGDPRVAQRNGGTTRGFYVARLFFQDTWRLRHGFTLNYGLAWNIDRNRNYDLSKPALLAPVLGADGLGPTGKQWKNFSPVLGIAWAPGRDGKTVIRAGAGIFYDFFTQQTLDPERALLGRPGLGRNSVAGSSIRNPLPGIAGVPVGTALNFRGSPTLFTGGDLMSILGEIRADQERMLAYTGDPSVRSIQILKQASATLEPVNVPNASSQQMSIGVQRQVTRDFVVSGDFVYRHFIHQGLVADLNHFNSVRGPVIPQCTSAQQNDPFALCSTGPVNVLEAAGRQTYKGLLLRADRRLSHGFQILGSWALSSNRGTNATGTGAAPGFNLDNWLQNYGPLTFDFTHIVNLAVVKQFPWRIALGLNFSYMSVPPFSASLGGIDLNGDGIKNDLLPGTTVDEFNRGMGRADLERLVAQFNQAYAGSKDAAGAVIRAVALPARYSFGDNFHALDLRLSRIFALRERWRLSLIGEVFNLYNKANLTGYSGDLMSAGFGQPTSRAPQVFGSGGPRAFQVAMRVAF